MIHRRREDDEYTAWEIEMRDREGCGPDIQADPIPPEPSLPSEPGLACDDCCSTPGQACICMNTDPIYDDYHARVRGNWQNRTPRPAA